MLVLSANETMGAGAMMRLLQMWDQAYAVWHDCYYYGDGETVAASQYWLRVQNAVELYLESRGAR
jgi:hypothetical protein